MNMQELHEEAQQSRKRGAIKAFRHKVLDEFMREFWKDKVMSDEERKQKMDILENVCDMIYLPSLY